MHVHIFLFRQLSAASIVFMHLYGFAEHLCLDLSVAGTATVFLDDLTLLIHIQLQWWILQLYLVHLTSL